MAAIDIPRAPEGFDLTSWRGVEIIHPADWELAGLASAQEPPRCTFADRRYQRLQVQWRKLTAAPDLPKMYEQLANATKDATFTRLADVDYWTGLVRQDKEGQVTHAGRYFQPTGILIEAVLVWPGRRDVGLERRILAGLKPQPKQDPVFWRAMRFQAFVPAEFSLSSCQCPLGKVIWEFTQAAESGKSRVPQGVLRMERLATPQYWLSGPLENWLAGQVPQEMLVEQSSKVDCGGHAGVELRCRRRGLAKLFKNRLLRRLERAWLCPAENRVYRQSFWQPGREIAWPAGAEIVCFR